MMFIASYPAIVRIALHLDTRIASPSSAAKQSGHSVSGGQPNDDENRVVLLAAAVHDGHGRPWIHRKTRGPNVRGRARVVSRRRLVARCAGAERGGDVEARGAREL